MLQLPGARLTAFSAASDGTLFAAAGPIIFRALPEDEYRTWTNIATAPTIVLDLFAFSRESVFAAGRSSIFMYRQDGNGDWQALDTAIPDSLLPDASDRGLGKPIIFGIWGRSERDFYVVGDYATILHFDGRQWTREVNPLEAYFHMPPPAFYSSRIGGIGGDSTRVFAASVTSLERSRDGWLPIAQSDSPEIDCRSAAVVVNEGDVFFAGGSKRAPQACLWRLRHGVPTTLNDRVLRLEPIEGGRVQQDGSALFWSYVGDVVGIRNGNVTIYPKSKFRAFAGAATLDSFLYVAGTAEAAVVARLRR